MTKRNLARGLAALALVLAVQACSSDAVAPPVADSLAPSFVVTPDPVTKTATASWAQRTTYDWTLEKTVTPSTLELGHGQTGTFGYTITVDRGEPTVVNAFSVSGQICVTNIAGAAAQITSVTDEFYSSAGLVMTQAVDFSGNAILDAGEQGCYPYVLNLPDGFAPDAQLTYWNIGKVSAVAVSGSQSGTAATDPVPVVWPATPTSSEVIDETATLVDDTYTCPAGFNCDFSNGSWSFSNDGTVTFDVLVENISAACDETFDFNNVAELTEDDTQTQHSDDAPSTVTTPECEGGYSACTPGFWQGGKGSKLWNVANDPQWQGASAQPFYAGTLFNSFFTPHPNMNGETMLSTIKNGGGSDPVNKAARSLVAAYLNTSYAGYPYGQAQLAAMWTAALAGGSDALLALHTDLDWKNNAYPCTN